MMHKESELSQWFNLSEQKPWEHGVVQVIFEYEDECPTYSFWNGARFGFLSDTADGAVRMWREFGSTRHIVSSWRGLSYDPSLPKKLSRNTDPATSKEAAATIVKSGAVKSHHSKIVNALRKHGPMIPDEISKAAKIRRSAVFRRMNELKGLVSRTGEKRGGQSVWNAI